MSPKHESHDAERVKKEAKPSVLSVKKEEEKSVKKEVKEEDVKVKLEDVEFKFKVSQFHHEPTQCIFPYILCYRQPL